MDFKTFTIFGWNLIELLQTSPLGSSFDQIEQIPRIFRCIHPALSIRAFGHIGYYRAIIGEIRQIYWSSTKRWNLDKFNPNFTQKLHPCAERLETWKWGEWIEKLLTFADVDEMSAFKHRRESENKIWAIVQNELTILGR